MTDENKELEDTAVELEEASKEALFAGASDLTAGLDDIEAADRAAFFSGVVATAGIIDVAEGADLLASAESVETASALMSVMSATDIDFGMELAGIAGQVAATGDILSEIDMPILGALLDVKGGRLRELAVDSLFFAAALRGVSAALGETGQDIATAGLTEIEEGATRLAMARGMAAGSEVLASMAEMELEMGEAELSESEVLDALVKGAAAEAADEDE